MGLTHPTNISSTYLPQTKEFSIKLHAIKPGWSIIYIYIEGSRVIICDSKNVSLSIKNYFILAIIADTNKMLHKAVSLLC